jgi:hypothetical protein
LTESVIRELLAIRVEIERVAQSKFTSELLNYHRDHKDSMGFHSDDEPETWAEPHHCISEPRRAAYFQMSIFRTPLTFNAGSRLVRPQASKDSCNLA